MRGIRLHPIAALLGLVLLPGCTFVSLAPGAEAIRIIDEADVQDCQDLGTTRVEVLSKVGFLPRNREKVSDELATLARNAAVDLNGNAIAASGPIVSGKRTYRVLRCR